jgi:hypothetical protein
MAVASVPWHDEKTRIVRNLGSWRASFPNARAANISRNRKADDLINFTDDDFVHLRGINTLDMSGCKQITDAAFTNLRGIHTLNMSHCNQVGITDAAFANLQGIHTLDMAYCNQVEITDAAFVHLRGVQKLDMWCCDQASITNEVFTHFRGIHTLKITDKQITNVAIAHLRGIHTLHIHMCDLIGITGASIALLGIHKLKMGANIQVDITFEAVKKFLTTNAFDIKFPYRSTSKELLDMIIAKN